MKRLKINFTGNYGGVQNGKEEVRSYFLLGKVAMVMLIFIHLYFSKYENLIRNPASKNPVI